MTERTKTRDFFFSIYARRSPTQGLIRPDGEKLLTSDNRPGWTGNVSTYIVARIRSESHWNPEKSK